MLRRACPVPAPLGPLASTLPVRSYRCASLLIPGVVPLRRSSWNEPAPFRLGARPGSRCRCAPPRCLTAHRPVTPHRILRLPTASLPCSPDALDPRPLSRPSGRHDERVPLRPCHAATGRGARTARPPLLVGPCDQLLRGECPRTGHQLSEGRSLRRSPCPHGLRSMTVPHRSGS